MNAWIGILSRFNLSDSLLPVNYFEIDIIHPRVVAKFSVCQDQKVLAKALCILSPTPI